MRKNGNEERRIFKRKEEAEDGERRKRRREMWKRGKIRMKNTNCIIKILNFFYCIQLTLNADVLDFLTGAPGSTSSAPASLAAFQIKEKVDNLKIFIQKSLNLRKWDR